MSRLWFSRALKLIAVGALLAAFMPTAKAAPTTIGANCNTNITGDAVLTQDLTCSTGQNGVNITGGNPVTLDLAGHTINGPVANIGVSISPGAGNVTIKNGTIRQFNVGIAANSVVPVTITGVRVAENATDGVQTVSSNLTITKSVIVLNGQDGVSADGDNLATVTGSMIGRNGRDGIRLDGTNAGSIAKNRIVGNTANGLNLEQIGGSRSEADAVVSGNTISANGADGVRLGNTAADSTVTGNIICGNNNVGVHVAASQASSNVIEKNKDICGSGIGVLIEDGDSNQVIGNTVRSNRSDGIDVLSPSAGTVVEANKSLFNGSDGIDASGTTTLTKNTVTSNGGFGIVTAGGITDGGGNKASDNVAGQCQGVVCA